MASEAEVAAVCSQLVAAVGVMMDPTTPRERRAVAFQKCEEFKQSSPMAVQCGLQLAAHDRDPVVRHFGLKILEDTIRLRWNDMAPEQKVFVKENAMRMLRQQPAQDPAHLKDGASRLAVEIAKREWPQQWPSFFSELDELCTLGETQAEMAMLVLLRLVEDVAVLQNLEQSQRRREIYQALTAHMEEIFTFLLRLLERHYGAYSANRQLEIRHGQVCRAVLRTFAAFVEWVAISHVMANDRYLVRCLCTLLSDESLQMEAGECLLGIVGWKSGKIHDRMQLLALFKTEMMAPLFQAAERANERASESEDHYNVLKKVVQILVELGGQLCGLWAKDNALWTKELNGRGRPENFDVYLNALLAFAGHPSQTVNLLVNELWAKFFRHTDISRDEVFKTYVSKWVAVTVKKFLKVGQPSLRNHPSCAYSLLDFDTDEEFNSFFGRFRIIIVEAIRVVSAENPFVPFQHAEVWLKKILASPRESGNKDGKCTMLSPTYLELDAVANLLDAVLGKLSEEQIQPVLVAAIELAKLCFDYDCGHDPVVTSAYLSVLSSLFVAVARTPDTMLMTLLNHVFACVTFTEEQATVSATGAVEMTANAMMVRRHGCSLMVKLATKQPKVFLPLFGHLRDTILDMRRRGQIKQMEFCTLVESLVLIANEMQNYSAQLEFLKLVCEPIWKQFHDLEPYIQAPEAFADFIGLTKPPPVNSSVVDQFAFNRSEVSFCLAFILCVCRRSNYPSQLAQCRMGNFVREEGENLMVIRNPAWQMSVPLLRYVFMLAKTVNGLWAPEIMTKFNPYYSKTLEMLESEKNVVIGVGNNSNSNSGGENAGSEGEPKVRSPLVRMKAFVFDVYENNYHLLSQWCSSCGGEFFTTPHLGAGVVGNVLHGIAHVPDIRLRSIVRMFLKTLINKCPRQAFAAVIAPVFRDFCPYMLSRLSERWKQLTAARESPSFDEDNTDSQEVVDDVVCRNLAREYLDVIKALLTSGDGSDAVITNLPSRSSSRNAISNGDDNGSGNRDNNKASISELGELVLADEALGNCMTVTALQALLWPDSPSSVRACNLLELVLPVLVGSGRICDADAGQVMANILSAIHALGQHELNYIALISLAIQAYELLRPTFPSVAQILSQVPGCNPDDLRRFDEKMLAEKSDNSGSSKSGDRTKKDMFKKLISQFIGKEVAQMFRHDVVIKNLPTMQMLKPRHKTPSIDDTEKKDIGLTALFTQNGQQ